MSDFAKASRLAEASARPVVMEGLQPETTHYTGWIAATPDCRHWLGLPPEGCDVPYWVAYLAAESIGIDPSRKITLECPAGG